MTETDYFNILKRRIESRKDGPLHAQTLLRHFSLINYALPKERLIPYIPQDRFDIQEFVIGGRPMAMISAVVFYDVDFHFVHLAPFVKDSFGQTNYRAYVVDKRSGEQCAWFFGTTLGSPVVHGVSALWRIPWYPGRYRVDCRYDSEQRRYERYIYTVRSYWGRAHIEIEDTGELMTAQEGFSSLEEMALVITHPVEGFFYRKDGGVGTYSVWHEQIELTMGRPRALYFGLFERLGLLSREVMLNPHSTFISPSTEFRIHLPPRIVTASE